MGGPFSARVAQTKYISPEQEENLKSTFNTIYLLRPLLEADGGEKGVECILLKSYPEGWLVARKPKIGPPVVLLESAEKPSAEEVRAALEGSEPVVDSVLSSVGEFFVGKQEQ